MDNNPTVNLIISRLPKKDLVTPREIADAFSFVSVHTIMAAIDEGKLAAVKVGSRYLIAHSAAVTYITSTAI